GVHVRDEDTDDDAVELGENLLPRCLHEARSGQTQPGADERPPLVAAEEVAVHVARTRRQRERHPGDARFELYQSLGFPGAKSHAWKNLPRSRPESRSAIATKPGVVTVPKRFCCASSLMMRKHAASPPLFSRSASTAGPH